MTDGGNIHAGTVRVWLCLLSGSKTVEKGKGNWSHHFWIGSLVIVWSSIALFSLLSNSDKSGRVEMETLSWLLLMFYQVILGGLDESLLPSDQTQKQFMEKLLLKCLEYVQSSKVRSQLQARCNPI